MKWLKTKIIKWILTEQESGSSENTQDSGYQCVSFISMVAVDALIVYHTNKEIN